MPVEEQTGRGKRVASYAAVAFAAALVGALLGAFVRGLFPPFVLDDPFWRDFWSGPPAAGLFAVLAAVIAFFPAYRSTRIARDNAEREQWWNRAEWALARADSDKQLDREVANTALVALSEEASKLEFDMIYRVIENLQGESAVDNAPKPADNGKRWRWFPWPR